jgi:hypothetical protein
VTSRLGTGNLRTFFYGVIRGLITATRPNSYSGQYIVNNTTMFFSPSLSFFMVLYFSEILLLSSKRIALHCKKGYRFSRPQSGCHWPNSPWTGRINYRPERVWSVTYRLGTGNSINIFYSVYCSTRNKKMA